MSNLNYLNLGCGNKFHKDWVNVDLVSNSPYVKSYNLLKGLPFPDDHFNVIYHSHVLEHLPKEKAPDFIRECFRVLKPDGIMRIVVPDLENIAREYLKLLNENIENPSKQSEANYDWILLEMYDQTVRNYNGGQMAEFLKQSELVNEEYVLDRSGYVGKCIRNNYTAQEDNKKGVDHFIKAAKKLRTKTLMSTILNKLSDVFSSPEKIIGTFRLSGEVHMWMYDRFSLSRLLRNVEFADIKIKGPYESDIPQWDLYELDVKDGAVFDPTSLFMEARKPK